MSSSAIGLDRPSWDDTWLVQAEAIGQRSLCTRDKVGAVIVDARNRPLISAYNGPPAGFPHNDAPCIQWCPRAMGLDPLDSDYRDCPSNHAEANAITMTERSAREGGTIYVTSHSCHNCCKLIANSGLARLVVKPRLHTVMHRQSDSWYAFLHKCDIIVDIIVSGKGAASES